MKKLIAFLLVAVYVCCFSSVFATNNGDQFDVYIRYANEVGRYDLTDSGLVSPFDSGLSVYFTLQTDDNIVYSLDYDKSHMQNSTTFLSQMQNLSLQQHNLIANAIRNGYNGIVDWSGDVGSKATVNEQAVATQIMVWVIANGYYNSEHQTDIIQALTKDLYFPDTMNDLVDELIDKMQNSSQTIDGFSIGYLEQPNGQNQVMALYKPTEDSSTEDSSTEDSSTEDSSTEDSSTEDSSTEDSSTEDSSTEDSSTEDNSTEDSSTEDSSTEDSSTEDSSTEDSSTEDSSTEDNSTEDSSTEDSSTEDSSTEDSSTEDSSTEDSSTEDSSTEDSSTEDSSTEEHNQREQALELIYQAKGTSVANEATIIILAVSASFILMIVIFVASMLNSGQD